MNFNDVLHEIRFKSITEHQKGADFERLMKNWFMTDPRYNNLTDVWLWEEFPARHDLGGKDLGIDLVAKTELGEYWAIQCKCYAEDATIDKKTVDSFLSCASRSFIEPETLKTCEFSNLIWVQTSRKKWGGNAELALKGLSKGFNRILPHDLEESPVNWEKLWREGVHGKQARLWGRQPMAHQLRAISDAHKHFIENGASRGKLIMACGTGKTYTSLRIMESMTEKDALVLFLVPSIALLGQTLNAWMRDKQDEIKAVCVCSDAKVTRKMMDSDEEDEKVADLAVPASTNVESIKKQLQQYDKDDCRTVIFSTYQSIDVVKQALDAYGREVDLIVCDEAHRTTGVVLTNKNESNFTKVHNNSFIKAKKRLYMTATPRLYREAVKIKAKQNENVDVLCSMDDKRIYGQEFHRLTFNEAVNQNLLADYKVLVLTVAEDDVPKEIRENLVKKYEEAKELEQGDELAELNFDDATKIIGCINALSKRVRGDRGVTWAQDPVVMKRAVAFCQTIRPTERNPKFSSTQIAQYFPQVCKDYKETLSEEARKEVVDVKAKHIDGSMDATTRNDLIAWLKEESPDNECRVLCNVRCLSEGVDVPALDAVLFLSPRNSEVEVVQSVGRVMRSFGKGTDHEKKYGYIVIPVIIPDGMKPEQALEDNERFKVVWTILNALRSHDENFNAHVNHISLNKQRPPKITIAGIPHGTHAIGGEAPDDAVTLGEEEVSRQLEFNFGELQDGIYAKLVEKVGDKMYWENWASSVGEVAKKFIQRIATLIQENAEARAHFDEFVKGLQKNINDSVDRGQAIEMLAQHLITRPVFDALFKDYQFVQNNPVSRSMQAMIEFLETQGLEMETSVLEKFYTSVRINVGDIDNLEGKQTVIKNLYEKFFKKAFPLTVEKLGIVYTPVECVDFIIHSVEAILQDEFGLSLTDENVHILDPFTGTGTFITRLLQSGCIRKEDMTRKYRNEIHCNEIVLLAYYVADVNIESVYHDIMRPEKYLTYDGICLTDTFQLSESGSLSDEYFPENTERAQKQKKTPVRVIIGNPPYSIGQKNANDNAQNLHYPRLEARIGETYAKYSCASLKNSLYDSYIKAFRWASDRISKEDGGIVAFISNGAWIDGNAQDGMRKCLEDEFTSIYVFNLRGNQRTSGELSRKEGGKIFGSGSRTPIAITFLVKNPAQKGNKAVICYHDIGDYLTQKEKLNIVRGFKSVSNIDWDIIEPTEKHDWINQRDGLFDSLILLGDKGNNASQQTFFVPFYSNGLQTHRDSWCYNSSVAKIQHNMRKSIDFYNKQVETTQEKNDILYDSTQFVWTRATLNDFSKGKKYDYNDASIRDSSYRPFFKQKLFFYSPLNEMTYQIPKLFPTEIAENRVICLNGAGGTKEFGCLMTSLIPDLGMAGACQCFPLYWYEPNPHRHMALFDGIDSDEAYIRRDGVTDWILKEVRKRYGNAHNITKEMIFYYVYGILHSRDYRERFAADLKKSLPRIPIVEKVEDFTAFSDFGRKLAALHLNYETVPPCPGVVVKGDRPADPDNPADYDYFRVVKMKPNDDKSAIFYNGNVTIENIPEKAYQYVVNGKSAIDWLLERYCVSQDKKTLIVNDTNDWAREHKKPRYILDLILSVINVSVQTVEIMDALPKLTFSAKGNDATN
ncbi:MAG: DEAD/DEAH box helicase [Thermoguttaceae bacterium]|nr:DEAD/DEAH box helicase [Thermoguttaceae bacterium]